MTIKEMKNKQIEIESAIDTARLEKINEILFKLYNHHMNFDNPHYNFLLEIERDLQTFKYEYL